MKATKNEFVINLFACRYKSFFTVSGSMVQGIFYC